MAVGTQNNAFLDFSERPFERPTSLCSVDDSPVPVSVGGCWVDVVEVKNPYVVGSTVGASQDFFVEVE